MSLWHWFRGGSLPPSSSQEQGRGFLVLLGYPSMLGPKLFDEWADGKESGELTAQLGLRCCVGQAASREGRHRVSCSGADLTVTDNALKKEFSGGKVQEALLTFLLTQHRAAVRTHCHHCTSAPSACSFKDADLLLIVLKCILSSLPGNTFSHRRLQVGSVAMIYQIKPSLWVWIPQAWPLCPCLLL